MKTRFVSAVLSVLCGATLGAFPSANAMAAGKLAEVRVYPAEVNLTTVRDRQIILVQAVFDDGLTQDVTAEAQISLSDPKIAKVEGNRLTPAADGQGEVVVAFGGLQKKLPLTVARSAEDPAVSFKLDVMPVFMKAGCNTGSCHGAARGKDGFRLSLFGFDPDGDHHRLTRELATRRINLALPSESLLIEKSIGAVPHTGGKRFDEKSELYDVTMRWLKAGAPKDPGEVPAVTRVEIYPEGAVLNGKGRPAGRLGPSLLRRWHGPRCHVAGLLQLQQRQLGHDFTRRRCHRGEPRRGVHHGPIRHAHRRDSLHRVAQRPGVRLERAQGQELH